MLVLVAVLILLDCRVLLSLAKG